jgi:hypothetical protein
MSDDATTDLARRRLLGRGLRCDPVSEEGRDLVMTRTVTGALDLAFVEGVANLGQALSVAVMTPLGGDVFNTAFGFDGLNALSDESSGVIQRERVRVAIVNLLRKDARVSRVVDVKLLDQRLDAPQTGSLRTLEVRVVFETVTSDQMTLTTGPTGTGLGNG